MCADSYPSHLFCMLIIFNYSILPFKLYFLDFQFFPELLSNSTLSCHLTTFWKSCAHHWTRYLSWSLTSAQYLVIQLIYGSFSPSGRTAFTRDANVCFQHLIKSKEDELMLKEARHSAGINWCSILMSINNTDLHYLSMVNLPGLQMPWH